MSKVKAVIFDMDGVLIDAKEWHYEALNKALKLFGYEISRHDHLAVYDGLPTSKKLEMLTGDKGLPRGLHSFINEMKQLYTIEMVYLHCAPKFIHEYALSRLKREGYKIAVASNSIKNTVELMMDKANLLPYLDFFLSNQDVKNAKPDPEIYNIAIKKLGLCPYEAIVVEDNKNGIKAAQLAGAHVMEVESVDDVTYDNIIDKINECNREE